MKHCAHQNKDVPNGMGKRNKAITLEEHHAHYKGQASQDQLVNSGRFPLEYKRQTLINLDI